MRTILLVVFIAFCSFSFAQICKYEVNEQDPLTDDIIRTIKTRITSPTPFYYISYIRNGSDYKFKVEVGDYSEDRSIIPKDSELIMRAVNGEVFRMKAIEKAEPEVIKDFGSEIIKYKITYQTSEEALKAVAESGIMFIRIQSLKNSFTDQPIPDAVIEISKENAICLFK